MADLTSEQVPELAKEDLLPNIGRIQNELSDLKALVSHGFETGDDLDAASLELATYRETDRKLEDLLRQVKEIRFGLSDQMNVMFTEQTGELPKAALKVFAKPADMSKAEEKYWKEAEKAVEGTYDPEGSDEEQQKYYGTVTNIFKAKVEKHLGHDPFNKKKKKKKDKDKSKKKKSYLDKAKAYRFVHKIAQAPYLIFIHETNIPAFKLLRTDVRITDVATSQVLEAQSFEGKGKEDPAVKQYIAQLQQKYPGAQVKS
jgi:hypothetical protein